MDAEELIRVPGLLPEPVKPLGFDRDRAQVTINVLKLAREDLVRERAQKVVDVYLAFVGMRDDPSPAARRIAERAMAVCCSANSPHTNCARSFREICQTDPGLADEICTIALAILEAPGS